jgi:hypothetical protein
LSRDTVALLRGKPNRRDPDTGRPLSQVDETKGWRDRRDSNPKSNDAQSLSQKGIPPSSQEEWTQIWTQIPDKDRRISSQIVERWRDLSDELKRAVLAVVGRFIGNTEIV